VNLVGAGSRRGPLAEAGISELLRRPLTSTEVASALARCSRVLPP
jgi:hypothetical protein